MKHWIPYFLCFALLTIPALAHPGHGTSNPAHLLIEPIHLAEFAVLLIAIVTAICLCRRVRSR